MFLRNSILLHSVNLYSNILRRNLSTKIKYKISDDELSLLPKAIKTKKPIYDIKTAIIKCKEEAKCKFDETVEIAVRLGVDPRKPNQSVRGVMNLPNGTGKTVRIAVFAKDKKAVEAKEAGATIVGAEDLVKTIQDGPIDFDRCIATPDMMPLIGRIARILGPRGLMPNPKLGTVTTDVTTAIKNAMGGQINYRAEKNGIVHAGIGKVSFSEDKLLDNIRQFMIVINEAKPEGAKGKYLRAAHISSSMGRGFQIDIKQLDPASTTFMRT